MSYPEAADIQQAQRDRLESDIMRGIASQFTFRNCPRYVVLDTPFTYGDGDGISLYFDRVADGWQITETEDAIWRIESGVPLPKEKLAKLCRLVEFFGCAYRDGAIVRAAGDDVGPAIFAMLSAILDIHAREW